MIECFLKRIKIVLLIIICSSIACVRQRDRRENFVIYKDEQGNLQSEIHYINDTVRHGFAKYYYPNSKNVIKDEIEFSNGLKNGWHKHYRKDGSLESKIHWKNNIEDGENLWYYSNGVIEQKTFRIRGVQYGDAYYYYSNGKLKLYNCINSWGENIYALKYDSIGYRIKEDGMVFSPKFILLYESDTTQTPILDNKVIANKKIVVKTTVAQPPQTKTIIQMGELSKKLNVLPIEKYTATYTQTFNTAGKHTLVILGEITDLQGKIIKQDSAGIVLNVIE